MPGGCGWTGRAVLQWVEAFLYVRELIKVSVRLERGGGGQARAIAVEGSW